METDSEWMSISDMMSGLMLIFMFISISFMIEVKEDKEKIEKIARTYEKDKRELNKDLNLEFNKDLDVWEAEITKDNIIIFNSPNVLSYPSGMKIGSYPKPFFPIFLLITSPCIQP